MEFVGSNIPDFQTGLGMAWAQYQDAVESMQRQERELEDDDDRRAINAHLTARANARAAQQNAWGDAADAPAA